jgi:hypothetical protein
LGTADIAAAFNRRGMNERYFLSGNNSYYVLMPTGNLYAYVRDAKNDLAATLAHAPVATLGTAVYANPALLYAGTGQVAAVTATVDANGVVSLPPNAAFAGTVRITAIVSDGAEMTMQSFLFTVTDQAPTLQPIAAVTVPSSAGSKTVHVTAADPNVGDTTLVRVATVSTPLYALQQLYGLTAVDTSMNNARGKHEKYLVSSNGGNPAGGGLYVLTQTNMLYTYIPNAKNTLAATLAQPPVADFNRSTYFVYGNVYNNPTLLVDAPPPPAVVTSFPSLISLLLSWPTGYKGTFKATIVIGDESMETQESFLVTVY